ncbi:Coiled-coil domain-containing protein 93 [Fukomys damarensis]|uniref:Coiled-coil domain-containing protein 93 n=1 Tax=Fukomys damarensis TaxID=885580 RepID=A0A091DQT1_FUKDA|nr:Coiled-coil domain-containing protein 93 [Fukomys damarensis]
MGWPKGQEGQGVPEVETREDEEQNVKLTEILELLVAAGYFRARIKGLSPFDKVVGGMTWCITTCTFDIDVDLLFQENSTIGQKIALSEKIVSVLPRMKCPHQLEPHQIQGMDFIHIFPVVQWLVKRAIETREEMGDYIRSYSISQFQKTYSLPEDDDFIKRKDKAIKTVVNLSDVYKPRRKYKRQEGAEELLDEESRIHSTLLEYGRRYGFSRQNKTEKAEDKKTPLSAGLSATEKADVHEEDDLQAAEEQRVQSLMTKMTAVANEESRLTASSVGQIVGLCSAEIKQIVSEYAEKQSELSAEESPEKLGTSQLHHRKIISLNKQILQKTKHLEELQANHTNLQTRYNETKKTLTELKSHSEKLDKEQAALEKREAKADPSILQNLRALVAMNENLKSQEQEFKAHCREEMTRLQQEIETLKAERTPDEKTLSSGERHGVLTSTMTHSEDLDRRYNMEKEKLYKIRLLQFYLTIPEGKLTISSVDNLMWGPNNSGQREACVSPLAKLSSSWEISGLLPGRVYFTSELMGGMKAPENNSTESPLSPETMILARRNREIAILHRKIDEVPSRAELIQYQKRFIELYRQISAVHKETKQFFTLYNTLDDKKVYLEKEISLLNSIHENFSQAMASSAARDQFLRQMEQIVEGIKQSRMKMEKKKQENKMRRDQLNDQYLELLEKQRLYFKTVKEFKEEGRKNELLLSKVKAKAS